MVAGSGVLAVSSPKRPSASSLMPAEKYTYVSSRLIKGVFQLGGDVSALVPPLVVERLKAKVPARV